MRHLLLAGIIAMAALASPPDLSAQAFCDTQATGLQLPIPAYNKPWHQWSRCTRNSFLKANSSGAVLGLGTTNFMHRMLVNEIGALSDFFITFTSSTKISSGTLIIDGNASISFRVNGDTFVIKSDGFVGIGTDSPLAALHLAGSGPAAELTLDNTDAPNGKRWRLLSSVDGGFVFRDQDATSTRVKFATNGNVGLRDTSPDGQLEILSVSAADGHILAISSQPDVTGSIMSVLGNGNVGMGVANPSAQLELANAAVGADFIVETSTLIVKDGRVGIGLTNPVTELEVNGTVTATAYSGDGSVLTGVGSSAAANATINAKVNEGGGIIKGQCVYISGATGQTPQVSLCDNTVEGKEEIIGLAAETKADSQNILVTVVGEITSVDTDGTGSPGTSESWSDGDALYATTAGNLTNVFPTVGAIIHIAQVGYAHGSQGKLVVSRHQEHFMATPEDQDITLRVGDTAGVNHVHVLNYDNIEVIHLRSNGAQNWKPETQTTSTMSTTGALQIGATDDSWFEGSVGIGTTSPATKLDVEGSTITASMLRLREMATDAGVEANYGRIHVKTVDSELYFTKSDGSEIQVTGGSAGIGVGDSPTTTGDWTNNGNWVFGASVTFTGRGFGKSWKEISMSSGTMPSPVRFTIDDTSGVYKVVGNFFLSTDGAEYIRFNGSSAASYSYHKNALCTNGSAVASGVTQTQIITSGTTVESNEQVLLIFYVSRHTGAATPSIVVTGHGIRGNIDPAICNSVFAGKLDLDVDLETIDLVASGGGNLVGEIVLLKLK